MELTKAVRRLADTHFRVLALDYGTSFNKLADQGRPCPNTLQSLAPLQTGCAASMWPTRAGIRPTGRRRKMGGLAPGGTVPRRGVVLELNLRDSPLPLEHPLPYPTPQCVMNLATHKACSRAWEAKAETWNWCEGEDWPNDCNDELLFSAQHPPTRARANMVWRSATTRKTSKKLFVQMWPPCKLTRGPQNIGRRVDFLSWNAQD